MSQRQHSSVGWIFITLFFLVGSGCGDHKSSEIAPKPDEPARDSVSSDNLGANSGPSATNTDIGVDEALKLLKGDGVERQPAQATKMLQSMAANGNSEARFALFLHAGELGLAPAAALDWLHQAADQGFAPAQFSLGQVNEFGEGVPVNLSEARNWYERAAKADHVEAQYGLALLLCDPESPVHDHATGLEWLARAAQNGHSDSQFLLGTEYQSGITLSKDEAAARQWYGKAASQGHQEARQALDVMGAADVAANGSSLGSTSSPGRARPAQEQRAIDQIHQLHGKVRFDDSRPERPVVAVSFRSQRRVNGADLDCLSDLPTIVELDLEGTSVKDVSLLSGLSSLRVLHLPDLTPDQIPVLAKLPALESLSIGVDKPSPESAGIQNRFKDREATREFESQDFLRQAIEGLSGAPNLKHLRIKQGGSGTSGKHAPRVESFDALAAYKSLAFVDISSLSISNEVLADLGECANLEILAIVNMNGNTITGEGIGSLSRCKKLRVLSVKRANDDILSAAAKIGSLEKFESDATARVSDSLLIALKRDNARLKISLRPPLVDWWSEVVVKAP